MSNVSENGSWAQSDVKQVLNEKGIEGSSVALSNLIGAFARSAASNLGLTDGSNTRTIRFFNGIKWAPITVVINIVTGKNR